MSSQVVGELALEVGDGLLLALDRGLDLLELASGPSAVARSGCGFFVTLSTSVSGVRCLRTLELVRPQRARADVVRPARRRSCGSCRPRSRAFARRPRRGARGRGRRAAPSPGKFSSAASSASRLSRSRWFVGSSRTRKFAPGRDDDREREPPPLAAREHAHRLLVRLPAGEEEPPEQVLGLRPRAGPSSTGRTRAPCRARRARPRAARSTPARRRGRAATPVAVARRAASRAASSSRRRSGRRARRARRGRSRSVTSSSSVLVAGRRATGPRPRRPSSRCAAG